MTFYCGGDFPQPELKLQARGTMKNLLDRFDTLITGYSLLLLIGGVIGYIMAGSLASLFMSSIFAILLLSSLFLIRFYPTIGDRSIFTLLALLTLFFAYRWYAVKFMPSGLLCLLTIVIAGFALSWRKKSA